MPGHRKRLVTPIVGISAMEVQFFKLQIERLVWKESIGRF